MQDFWSYSKDILLNYGLPVFKWGGWVIVVAILFKYDEGFDRWGSRFERILLGLGLKRDKDFIKKDVRFRINSSSKKINKQAEGIVTAKAEIVWTNEDNVESFLRDGKVIIRMRHHSNQDKNIVNAILHYTKAGVLNTGKRYLSPALRDTVDLALTKKIISEEKDTGTALEYFSRNILEPSLESNAQLKNKFTIIQLLEKKGLFTRILLREIRLVGKNLYPEEASEAALNETEAFFNFLEPFAKHSYDANDILNWEFIDNNIRMGIVFVARQQTMQSAGIMPYKYRIDGKISRGCQKIYMFGRGNYNISAIRALSTVLRRENPNIEVAEEIYPEIKWNKRNNSVCSVVSINEDSHNVQKAKLTSDVA